MKRKRITEVFPFLAPLRRYEKKKVKYLQMMFDNNKYSSEISKEFFPFEVFSSTCLMLNESTGFDMKYQYNKVYNLKLVAKTMNGLLIKPNEIFSFWWNARHANEKTPYKEGLITDNGKTTILKGGGLCQISNLLFWVFLHSKLDIIERHGHDVKDFKEPASDAPQGVDATIYEGWLDLQFKNNTDEVFQLKIEFIDDKYIKGTLYSNKPQLTKIKVINDNCEYYRKDGIIYEEVDIVKQTLSKDSKLISNKIAYRNKCEIAYELDKDTKIIER